MSHTEPILNAAKRLRISPEAVQTYLDAGRGERALGVERSLHATIKPVGSACNLDCTYCYYLSKEELLSQKSRRIKDEALERFIVDYIQSQDAEEIAFTWHGGEPTLMGLPFFRRVVELQQKHLPAGRRISNDLQTNGTLLNEEWYQFLADNAFLVGLSIDGPRALHDFYRPTKKGKPTFDKVFEATQRLKQHGIQFSTLTTVNRHNASHALEVYRFLRDEVGTSYMQFIPCVEPRQFERHAPAYLPAHQLVNADSARAQPGHPMSVVTDWSVVSEEWGSFLATVFDEWQTHDQGRVKINLFESLFAQLNGKPSLMCTSSPFCGKNVALEHDGRVYSCDHFVYPEYELGKVGEQTLAEMVFSLKQLEFGLDKHNSLPSECRACPYLKLCWGECPRTRILKTREGEGNLSYLCKGWKIFFAHALPKIPRTRAQQAPLFPTTSIVRRNSTQQVPSV
ncbi:MAG TPA: anaerobic sulfatase maturase [Polyangiaceae bacterium]|nr:anaerobic sulfatase maturase [Polyangiaceae bacterium]